VKHQLQEILFFFLYLTTGTLKLPQLRLGSKRAAGPDFTRVQSPRLCIVCPELGAFKDKQSYPSGLSVSKHNCVKRNFQEAAILQSAWKRGHISYSELDFTMMTTSCFSGPWTHAYTVEDKKTKAATATVMTAA
jgi:hypothetical protein